MSLCQPDKVADSHNLMVVLAHLQGVAATFRVGRHHHRGPLHEGRGLTHALTHDAPTDLTVAAALVRKASSKRRRSRLWPKPVNLRTWALVSDSIVMVQALAELRCGVVAYTRAKQCEIWAQFRPNPLPAEGGPRELDRVLAGRVSLGHYSTSSPCRGHHGRGEAEARPRTLEPHRYSGALRAPARSPATPRIHDPCILVN